MGFEVYGSLSNGCFLDLVFFYTYDDMENVLILDLFGCFSGFRVCIWFWVRNCSDLNVVEVRVVCHRTLFS